MSRVEISRIRKLKKKAFWKEFNKNFIKKYLKFLGFFSISNHWNNYIYALMGWSS